MSETVVLRVRTAAAPERVRRALTDAAELRVWLTEHAEADLPDRWRFWGRHTPEGDEPRQVLEHVDDSSLAFRWTIGGEETSVELRWAAEDGGTLVSVSQSHFPGWAEAVAETGVLAWLYTFWTISLANLVDHVEGRPITARIDYTTHEMRVDVVVDAPAEAVGRSLVDPGQYSRWFGAKVDIEPWDGGRFAMGGFDADDDPGRVVGYEPGRRMGIEWDGLVAGWELAESGGRTRLTFVQSGFVEGRPPYGAWAGWLAGLAGLRRFHELPDWRPIWVESDVPGLPEDVLVER
ncbi:SRPBCC family protein [Saccharothrix lopnurensis]|uniref:SRPBCC domain-containing protein n=1 Tax=Saccharothrix lopnurensis TaxID=1670621 RepID=A0ABW1P0Z6_9PSEU